MYLTEDIFVTHHIGYAVKSIDGARSNFTKFGFIATTGIIVDKNQHVYVQLMKHKKSKMMIELVSNYDAESPIDKILQKNGPMPYHICYEYRECISIKREREREREMWEILKKIGLRKLTPKKFSPLFQKYVRFLFSKDTGVIEIITDF